MDNITITDFQKLDIRIGNVTKAEVPEWSHWVMRLEVEFGDEIGKRTVFAGIMKHYKTEEIEGKQFPFVVNIEPKKIGPEGDYSQGMMMAADLEGKPVLLIPTEQVPNGTKIR